MSAVGPRILLATMVKDEAPIIGRMIRSTVGIIDGVGLMDTGCSDGTVPEAAAVCAEHHLPFTWWRRHWQNFGENRTQLLRYAARLGYDWLLTLDADHELEVDVDAWLELLGTGGLIADGYMLRILDDPEYRLPYLIRSGGPTAGGGWSYVGWTHEALSPMGDFPHLDVLSVRHHCDGSRRPIKFVDDLRLLTEAHEQDPTDARTVYYLAATCRDLGSINQAIVLFEERAGMGGFPEEAWYAAYQAASLRQDPTKLLEVWQQRPRRLEPLLEAVRIMRADSPGVAAVLATQGLTQPPPVGDVLFVSQTARAELVALLPTRPHWQ